MSHGHDRLNPEDVGRILRAAYPLMICNSDHQRLYFHDGTEISLESPSLDDAIGIVEQVSADYPYGKAYIFGSPQLSDIGRVRCIAFLKKMYGATQAEVERQLVEIDWMPKHVGKKIRVTRANGVDRQLQKISEELDQLPRGLRKYVSRLGGSYNWRTIAATDELSPHAFGIAIDINVKYANYWHWDLQRDGKAVLHNQIPQKIVDIFERHGFIWGGKWRHYDTMHFEYRPELIIAAKEKAPRKNILFLTRDYCQYGAERQLSYLVADLPNTEFSPIVVHAERGKEGAFQTAGNAIHLHLRLRPWRKIFNLATRYLDAYRLLRLAQGLRIDLIHCSYHWLLPYALFAGRRLGVPVVAHIRRPNNPEEKMQKIGLDQCDAVIVVSPRIKRELEAIPGLAQKVHLIHDAVDILPFAQGDLNRLRDELHLGDALLFGLVGRVYKTKRQLDFVRAAETLLSRHANVHFVIVGRVDEQSYWQQVQHYIEEKGLSNRIHYLGHRDDMPHVIRSLDVLVSLSGGSVMYEAMAAGKTVISSGFTKPEDSMHVIHNRTGMVSESKSLDSLVELIEITLQDKTLRSRLGANARAWAESHLSTGTLVQRTVQVYKEQLDQGE